uniref:Uncharacterized protein n=1 Tax=Anguilla anguilla TaxID=7936 RepID=A0A0E9VB61_ANGAN
MIQFSPLLSYSRK